MQFNAALLLALVSSASAQPFGASAGQFASGVAHSGHAHPTGGKPTGAFLSGFGGEKPTDAIPSFVRPSGVAFASGRPNHGAGPSHAAHSGAPTNLEARDLPTGWPTAFPTAFPTAWPSKFPSGPFSFSKPTNTFGGAFPTGGFGGFAGSYPSGVARHSGKKAHKSGSKPTGAFATGSRPTFTRGAFSGVPTDAATGVEARDFPSNFPTASFSFSKPTGTFSFERPTASGHAHPSGGFGGSFGSGPKPSFAFQSGVAFPTGNIAAGLPTIPIPSGTGLPLMPVPTGGFGGFGGFGGSAPSGFKTKARPTTSA